VAGRRGRLEQSARLVADQAGPQRRWRVRLHGEVRRSNRRNYVRAMVAFPLTVSAPGLTFAGAGLDVSEGGLRCRLPKPEDQDAQSGRALASLDGQVTVRFTLEGEEFTMPGMVVRTIPVEGGGRELGIRFVGVTRGSADSIRRAVFAVERRQRAAGVLG
jgi:c-di-GMP-binding flagellar brake protein YcgR